MEWFAGLRQQHDPNKKVNAGEEILFFVSMDRGGEERVRRQVGLN